MSTHELFSDVNAKISIATLGISLTQMQMQMITANIESPEVRVILNTPQLLIDWSAISVIPGLSHQFMQEFEQQLDFAVLPYYQELNAEFVLLHFKRMGGFLLNIYHPALAPQFVNPKTKLDTQFFNYYQDQLDWEWISEHLGHLLPDDFINQFAEQLDWYWISVIRVMNSAFLRKFSTRLQWDEVSLIQELTQNDLMEFADQLNWALLQENPWIDQQLVTLHHPKFNDTGVENVIPYSAIVTAHPTN